MKLIINKDRTTISMGTWGTENENKYEILDLEFPEEFNDYNKRIVYYLDEDRKWDLIENNQVLITNAVTKYESVKAYIWFTKSEKITLKYVCAGTEIGHYYFTYNNENHYFTMPEVEANDELIYDVSTNKLKLNNTEIATTSTGTGNELLFSTIIDAEKDFRTKLFEMQFYENENADGLTPTQEEVDGFNTMLTQMNSTISSMEQLEQQVEQSEVERNANVQQAIADMNTAMQGVDNLNIEVSDKVDGDVTITLTKKDATTKTVVLSDGTSLEFNWNGTSLGIKTEDDEEYTYVDLQGVQGPVGPQGEAFQIKKTYPSVEAMNADFNNMQLGDYVMIASTVEIADNAKLYTRGELQWIFISDFSGAQGIKGETGATPNIQIGTVTQGETMAVTRSGTNENPIFNFTLVKGDKGDKGNTGNTGATGNGIASISKTGTSGLVDTYTITYTNGNTTTFTVTNGKGITSIEKTGTSGLIDTYTITYTDGTTTSYTVTNGQDGEITQEVFDSAINELQGEIDDLNTLVDTELDTNVVEGTTLDVSDSAEYRGRIEVKGNTEQEQLSGKNKLDIADIVNGKNIEVSNDEAYSTNQTSDPRSWNYNSCNWFLNLPAGKYTISLFFLEKTTNTNSGIRIFDSNSNNIVTSHGLINVDNYTTTFTLTEATEIGIELKVFDGKCKIQLEEGQTATDYEPYCGGQEAPNPSYEIPIKVVTGDNVVKHVRKNLWGGFTPYSVKSYDINYVTNADGTVIANGTSTGYATSVTIANALQRGIYKKLSAGTYSVSGGKSSQKFVSIYDSNATQIGRDIGNGRTFTLAEDTTIILRAEITSGETANNEIFYIQLEENTTPTQYEPYREEEYKLDLWKENEFDSENATVMNALLSDGGSISANGSYRTVVVSTLPDTLYKISKNPGAFFRVADFANSPQINDEYISRIKDDSAQFIIFKTSHSANYLAITYWYTSDTTTKQEMLESIKIQQPLELCKIGDYSDILFKNVVGDENYNAELEEGAWYKKNVIGIISGSNQFTSNGMDDNRVGLLTPVLNIEANLVDLREKCFCNLLQTMQNNYSGLNGTTSSGKIRVYVSKEYVTTYEEAKQLLEDIIIYFVQLNPTYTKITDTTLISQLEALRKAKWFKGVNHWWTETENLVPYIKGTYKQSNKLKLDDIEARLEALEQE